MLKKYQIVFLLALLQATFCWAAKWKIGDLRDPKLPEQVVQNAKKKNNEDRLYVYTNDQGENLVFFPSLYISEDLQNQLPEHLQTLHSIPQQESTASSGGAEASNGSDTEPGHQAPDNTSLNYRQPRINSGKQRCLMQGDLNKVNNDDPKKIIKFFCEHNYVIIFGNYIFWTEKTHATTPPPVSNTDATCLLPERGNWYEDLWYATRLEDNEEIYWIELTPTIQARLLQYINGPQGNHDALPLLQPPFIPLRLTRDVGTEPQGTERATTAIQATVDTQNQHTLAIPETLDHPNQVGASFSAFQNLATQTSPNPTQARIIQTETPEYQSASSQTDDATQEKKPKEKGQFRHISTQTITEETPPDRSEDIQTAPPAPEANAADDENEPPLPEPLAATKPEFQENPRNQGSYEHSESVNTDSTAEASPLSHPPLSGSTPASETEETESSTKTVNIVTDTINTQAPEPPAITDSSSQASDASLSGSSIEVQAPALPYLNSVVSHAEHGSPDFFLSPKPRALGATHPTARASTQSGKKIHNRKPSPPPNFKKNKKDKKDKKGKGKKTAGLNPDNQKNNEKPIAKKEAFKKASPSHSITKDIRFFTFLMGAPALAVVAYIVHELKKLDFSTAKSAPHTSDHQKPKAEQPTTKTSTQQPQLKRITKAQPKKVAARPLVPGLLKKVFAEDEQMQVLLENLQQEDPFIRMTSLHEPGSSLSRIVTPEDIKLKLKKYSSKKSTQEGSVLFLSSLGKEVQYSSMSINEREGLLKYLQPRLKDLYQQAGLDFIESFHWLNLLCGFSQREEMTGLNCFQRVSNILSTTQWHQYQMVKSMMLEHQLKRKEKTTTPYWQLAPLWAVKSKQSLATTPIIIPVIYEKGKYRLIPKDITRSSIDNFPIDLMKAFPYKKMLSTGLQWSSASNNNLIKKEKFNFRSATIKVKLPNQKTTFLVFENAKRINPGRMSIWEAPTSHTALCRTLTTQHAVELCIEFSQQFSHFLPQLIKTLTVKPDLEVPLYTHLTSGSSGTEITAEQQHEQQHEPVERQEKMIVQSVDDHIKEKKAVLLTAKTLARVDRLSADQLSHILKAITQVIPKNLDQNTLSALLQLCGYIPHNQTQELCITNHLSVLSSPKSFSYSATTRNYMEGLPEFYHDLSEDHCRYLPTILLIRSEQSLTLEMHPSAQIIRNGYPQELISEQHQDREAHIKDDTGELWLGVDPDEEIAFISVAIVNEEGASRLPSEYYYPDSNDRSRVIPDRQHP
ncbi:MAG: hypothetical protein ACPG5T_00985, partial [Endozoicomonas sp.]